MTVSKPDWIVKPTPNVWIGTRLPPMAYVCHIAVGTLEAVDNTFAAPGGPSNPNPASANFCVGKNGEVHCYVDPSGPNSPWANGIVNKPDAAVQALLQAEGGVNPNWWTISCEHEGMPGDLLTPAQLDASAHLAAWCLETFNIPNLDTRLLGHYEIDSVNRPGCPGWNHAQWVTWEAAVSAYLVGPPTPQPPPDCSALEAQLAQIQQDELSGRNRIDTAVAGLVVISAELSAAKANITHL